MSYSSIFLALLIAVAPISIWILLYLWASGLQGRVQRLEREIDLLRGRTRVQE